MAARPLLADVTNSNAFQSKAADLSLVSETALSCLLTDAWFLFGAQKRQGLVLS